MIMNKIIKIILCVLVFFIWAILNMFFVVHSNIPSKRTIGVLLLVFGMIPLMRYIWNRPSPKDLQPPFPTQPPQTPPQPPKRGGGKDFDGDLYGKVK